MDDLGMRGGLTADPSYETSQVSIQPSASADVPPDSPLAMPVRPLNAWRGAKAAAPKSSPFDITLRRTLVFSAGVAVAVIAWMATYHTVALGGVTLAIREGRAGTVPVVHWLVVHPAWRRRGIGRLLMSHLERAAWDDGWREVEVEAPAGTRYRFRIEGRLEVPDPASRYNPDDVHGPSVVVDPAAFDWNDGAWRGRPGRRRVAGGWGRRGGCRVPAGARGAGAAGRRHGAAGGPAADPQHDARDPGGALSYSSSRAGMTPT